MPTAPRYISQVSPNVQAGPGLRMQASPQAFGSDIASGLQQLAAGGADLGEVFAANAVKMQAEDNQAKVDDQITSYMNAQNDLLYNPENGFYTKQGKNAVDAYPDTKQAMFKLRETMSGALPNEATQHMFDRATQQQLAFNLGNVSSHAAKERKTWLVSSLDASMEEAANTAGLNYDDPAATEAGLATIREQAVKKGEYLGWGYPQVKQEIDHKAGKLIASVVAQTAVNDPIKAQGQYDTYREFMDPDQAVTLGRQLKSMVLPQEARALVEARLAGLDASATVGAFANVQDGFDQVQGLIPGAVMTSGKRTAAANAAAGGVPNSKHLTGQAFDFIPPPGVTLQQAAKVVQNNFPGTKVLVEGPGAAHSTGPHVHVEFSKGFPAVAGTSVDLRANSSQFIAQVRADALAARPHDLVFADTAEALARQEVTQRVQEQTYKEKAGADYLLGAMVNNKVEGVKPTFNDYMKDPQFAAAYTAQPYQSKRAIVNQIVAEHGKPMAPTPESEARYHYLMGLQYTDPDKFLKTNMLTENIPLSQQHQLGNLQLRVANKQPKQMNANLQAALGDPAVREGMKSAGLTKAENPDDYAAYVGKFQTEIDAYVLLYNKQPTPKDLRAMAGNLMLKGPGAVGLWDSRKPYYKTDDAALLVNGVPDAEVASIAAALRQRDIPPTPELIQQYYKKAQANGG